MKFFNSIFKSGKENRDVLFSEHELKKLIQTLFWLSNFFGDSQLMRTTDPTGARNKNMMLKIISYAGILGYFYEEEYHYGKVSDFVNMSKDEKMQYDWSLFSIGEKTNRKSILNGLADNWSDMLQVMFIMQLEPNSEGNKLAAMKSDIDALSVAFEKLSGGKCREPKDPRKDTPKRNVSYNPYNISEDRNLIQYHSLPDLTETVARELLPQIISGINRGHDAKEIVANYAIDMIKTYYENAGVVPMVIVDQITGQVDQVAHYCDVSYSPYKTLKEYVLSKIYY